MDNPTWQDRTPDELAGTPELFATNLVLVEAIKNKLQRLIIKRHPDRVTVTLVNRSGETRQETLTESPDRWSKIRERFQSMTESHENKPSLLRTNIPAADAITEMRIQYPGPDEILIEPIYPDSD